MKWQYWVSYVTVDSRSNGLAGGKNTEVKAYLKEINHKLRGRHDPILLQAFLDIAGRDGWELVHIEPVTTISKELQWKPANVGVSYKGQDTVWINTYFVILRILAGKFPISLDLRYYTSP